METIDIEFTQNWMSLIKDDIKNKRLVDIVLPSTHNSNTQSLKRRLRKIAQNQIWSIHH